MPINEEKFQKQIEDEIQRLWIGGEFIGNIAKEVIRKVREYDRRRAASNHLATPDED